jgi:hypothetical protein
VKSPGVEAVIVSEAGLQDAGASRHGCENPRGEKPSTHGGGDTWVKLSLTTVWLIRRVGKRVEVGVR